MAEYGNYNLFSWNRIHKIKAEIYARGPVAAGINADPLLDYKGGVIKDGGFVDMIIDHIVSIVGKLLVIFTCALQFGVIFLT